MSHKMYPNSTFWNRDRHFSVTEEKSISMMAAEANEALLQSENEKPNGKSFKFKAASFSTISARQDSGFSGDIALSETPKITDEQRQSSVFRIPDSGTGSNEPIPQDRSPLTERGNLCRPLDEPPVIKAATILPQIEEQRDKKTSSVASIEWIKKEDSANENKQKRRADRNRERLSSSGHKTFFLKLPNKMDRQSSVLTREGTPTSGLNVATVPEMLSSRWKRRGNNAILAVISALYAKILVVMGLAFPMTEVISNHVTSSSYLGFYLYLYFGSILYFLYVVFITVLRKTTSRDNLLGCSFRGKKQTNPDRGTADFLEDGEASPMRLRAGSYSESSRTVIKRNHPTHHGSFYLRIGAVAFGVGSMIYSGLEFAQYFEESSNPKCHNVLMAITPAARMLFSFFQMYFIFLNSKMSVCTHKSIAYFGLMHMVATNLCVWLNVIIEETKHEILHFLHHNSSIDVHKSSHELDRPTTEDLDDEHVTLMSETDDHHDRIRRLVNFAEIQAQIGKDIIGGSLMDECKRSELMGNLVQDASPLLFPCAIEYSLISAAILYVMWKNVVSSESDGLRSASITSQIARRSRHHYSVDCAKANKGLFAGIFVFVLTIISLTLFFALINHPAYTKLAIMEVGVSRFVLFCLAFIATIIGIIQVRELRFDSSRSFDLDDVLLIFGQLGLMAYNIFTVIAGYYTLDHDEDGALVLLSALAALFQAIAQTLFILDASRRNTFSPDQQQRKPGREVVTFLLVCNFAMWTVNTLEKSRADVNPVQLNFYGLWPWIIIMNVSMPLAIFYRFHSTVVLCEIWKRCYKAKPEF